MYGRCDNCGNLDYLNHNNLCKNCSTYPGNSNPAPQWGTCTKCGQYKQVNKDGVCPSCNSGSKKGWW